jgi:hypothetical protein
MKAMKLFVSAVAVLALLLVPAGALAKRGDRDRDRMPDKWEKRHHLNTHANDARRDPDHDGLRNLSEFRHGTDPRDADSDDDGLDDEQEVEHLMNPGDRDTDDDGVQDDDEVSGTVQSFDGTTLVIKLAGDNTGTVSGAVTSATKVECENRDEDRTATASHDGESGDDNSGPGSGGDGSGTDDNGGPGSTDSGDDDQQADDDRNDDDNEPAQPCAIAVGDVVHEADFTTSGGMNTFTEVELVK